MTLKHLISLALLTLLPVALPLALAPSTAAAQFPWRRMGLFRRIKTDPNSAFPLTENNGPWMIMAATFAGDGAEGQVRDLIHELRSEFKLEAYSYRMSFNYQQTPSRQGGEDRYGRPSRQRYLRKDIKEFAVLVGNYPAIDDPQARKDLWKIKAMKPKNLQPEELKKAGKTKTYQQLVSFRLMQKTQDHSELQKQLIKQYGRNKRGGAKVLAINHTKQLGLMGSAFITRNPRRSRDYDLAVSTVDKFVYDMNKGVEFSLLDCPGKYTVKVATFKGSALVNQQHVRAVQQGDKQLKSRLEQAAMSAHELTVALRELGYDAYEFHDRYSSLVTIGGFDSVGTRRQDGSIQIDPKIQGVLQKFKAKRQLQGGLKVETLVGIPLDVQPVVFGVPRRSISADYIGGLLGARR